MLGEQTTTKLKHEMPSASGSLEDPNSTGTAITSKLKELVEDKRHLSTVSKPDRIVSDSLSLSVKTLSRSLKGKFFRV